MRNVDPPVTRFSFLGETGETIFDLVSVKVRPENVREERIGKALKGCLPCRSG